MKEYDAHPAAKLFPMLENGEMQELVADIKKNGLLHSIILHEGKILDGRNRFVACGIAKVDPHFEKFSGACSPTEYVLSTNLKRRQLTPTQRATVAANALPMLEAEAKERQGARNDIREKIPLSQQGKATEKAAEMVGVNPRYVADAKKIKDESPEVFEQMARGEKTISEAKKDMAKKRPRKRAGDFEQWRKFKSTCESISRQMDGLLALSVDADHVADARDIAEKLSRKLTSVIQSINK